MRQYRAKQEAVEREESKRSVKLSPKTKSTAEKSPDLQPERQQYCVSERVVLREVWVQQATLLIEQVMRVHVHL